MTVSSPPKKTRTQPNPQNALLHGLYAGDVVPPWENEQIS
jgi:hypothetical protein